MKKYVYLPITLLISLVVHITLLIFMPGLDFNPERQQNNIIEIEFYEPEIEEPAVAENTGQSENNQKTETPKQPVPEIEKQMISADKVVEETEVEVSRTMPYVDLPEYEDEPELPVDTPGFENLVSVAKSHSGKIKGLAAEIASAKASTDNSEKTSSGANNDNRRNNFFEIQSTSNMQRNLLRPYPPKPDFSLESDTTVTLSFMVDENGNTYDIIPLTRTDKRIEEIAVNYVKKLNFEAVSYSEPDKVEIKLFFEVK
jgi:hypothetical protein